MFNPNKVGLVIGVLIGGWHLAWSAMVLFGWAHMIRPVYIVKSFDPMAAITLIITTAALGYTFGLLGAMVWNKLHGR